MIVLIPTMIVSANAGYIYYDNMQEANRLADEARAVGYSETSELIQEYSRVWWENRNHFEYERNLLAVAIYAEAGFGCTEKHMEYVGAVAYNRILSPVWKVNNVYETLTAPRQYAGNYVDPNGKNTIKAKNSGRWEYYQLLAERVLKGESDLPRNVVFQSNFKQGTGVYKIYKTSYSTTYFCYGKS